MAFLSFAGQGAEIVGATVIGGGLVAFDGSISVVQEATISVPSQNATAELPIYASSNVALSVSTSVEADVDVVGSDVLVVPVPSQTATLTATLNLAADQSIAVPSQDAVLGTAYYVVVNQTIAVPSQSATGELPINAASNLADGRFVVARPVVGAFAVGDEADTGGQRYASAMVTITHVATSTMPLYAASSQSIAVPQQDADLRPLVQASSSLNIGLSSATADADPIVGVTEAATIAIPTQNATGTVSVVVAAGNQQVLGATNTTIIGVRVSAASDITVAAPSTATLGGPVVTDESFVTIAVPSQVATFDAFWAIRLNQTLAVPTQTAEAGVSVGINTAQTAVMSPVPVFGIVGAHAVGDETSGLRTQAISGLEALNTSSATVRVSASASPTIPAPAWTVAGGPVVQAAASASIAVPTQTATGLVFFQLVAAQVITAPVNSGCVADVDVAAQSNVTLGINETATADIDFAVTASQVIELASVRARAQIYKPTTRFRARRYGGTSYPQPTESGYLSWLSRWAS